MLLSTSKYVGVDLQDQAPELGMTVILVDLARLAMRCFPIEKTRYSPENERMSPTKELFQ